MYLVDQPRRGQAGQTTVSTATDITTFDQNWFTQFRIGLAPDYYPGVQFPRDDESLDQFFRQMTPNTGPYDDEVISDAMAAALRTHRTGVLVTHSQGGVPGWRTAMKSRRVRAVVAYEPAGITFPRRRPAGADPEHLPPDGRDSRPAGGLPQADQDSHRGVLRRQHSEPAVGRPGPGLLARRSEMARRWAAMINRNGGDATVVHLPEEGIRGNTHFLFSDLNNVEVVDPLSDWLRRKRLR